MSVKGLSSRYKEHLQLSNKTTHKRQCPKYLCINLGDDFLDLTPNQRQQKQK